MWRTVAFRPTAAILHRVESSDSTERPSNSQKPEVAERQAALACFGPTTPKSVDPWLLRRSDRRAPSIRSGSAAARRTVRCMLLLGVIP